jgi:hypothetical protein
MQPYWCMHAVCIILHLSWLLTCATDVSNIVKYTPAKNYSWFRLTNEVCLHFSTQTHTHTHTHTQKMIAYSSDYTRNLKSDRFNSLLNY